MLKWCNIYYQMASEYNEFNTIFMDDNSNKTQKNKKV